MANSNYKKTGMKINSPTERLIEDIVNMKSTFCNVLYTENTERRTQLTNAQLNEFSK